MFKMFEKLVILVILSKREGLMQSLKGLVLFFLVFFAVARGAAWGGNAANFVLYNHHTAGKGET